MIWTKNLLIPVQEEWKYLLRYAKTVCTELSKCNFLEYIN